MADELAENALEVPAVGDQDPVQALASDCADKSLSDRVGLRRPDRRVDHADALGREDVVEGARELPVVVTDQELEGPVAVRDREHEVPRLLRCPCTIRILGHASEVRSPAGELDEEQDIDPPQADGVGREEVARNHALGLTADELAPGTPVPGASRSEPGGGEDPTDSRRGDPDAETLELSGDPLVAPPRVLPREPHDQLANLPADRRAPGVAPPDASSAA
jgi:hypothetical protein